MKTLTTRLLILALLVAVMAPLAACGRKAAPDFPEGTEYPHQYPTEQKKQ